MRHPLHEQPPWRGVRIRARVESRRSVRPHEPSSGCTADPAPLGRAGPRTPDVHFVSGRCHCARQLTRVAADAADVGRILAGDEVPRGRAGRWHWRHAWTEGERGPAHAAGDSSVSAASRRAAGGSRSQPRVHVRAQHRPERGRAQHRDHHRRVQREYADRQRHGAGQPLRPQAPFSTAATTSTPANRMNHGASLHRNTHGDVCCSRARPRTLAGRLTARSRAAYPAAAPCTPKSRHREPHGRHARRGRRRCWSARGGARGRSRRACRPSSR